MKPLHKSDRKSWLCRTKATTSKNMQICAHVEHFLCLPRSQSRYNGPFVNRSSLIIHGQTEIWNSSSSVQIGVSRVSSANGWDIELNTRKEIPYLRATMYHFVYYINILLTKRSRLNSRFKTRRRCYSFTALNRGRYSDMSATQWPYQTHMKNYRNFSRLLFLSGGNPHKALQII